MTIPEDWAPEACTLPTAERPVRVAEFDEFFAEVLRFERPRPTRLELVIPAEAEATARDLADRESQCCSFFTFGFEPAGDDVVMHIGVPPTQIAVLDAIEARVALT
ncbi:MAG: hypothetical protein ACRDU5_18770 [Mycobacterium sp.]